MTKNTNEKNTPSNIQKYFLEKSIDYSFIIFLEKAKVY